MGDPLRGPMVHRGSGQSEHSVSRFSCDELDIVTSVMQLSILSVIHIV